MQKRIIVTDLDNTLLRGDKSVSDYSVDVLNRCRDNNITTVFATARPARATQIFQDKAKPDYVIADNGATVVHHNSIICQHLIPAHISDELIRAFAASPEVLCMTVEAGDCFYTDCTNLQLEKEWNAVCADLKDGLDLQTPKISVECENALFLEQHLKKFPDLHVYSNTGEMWHQIMRREASKILAITYLVKSLGHTLFDVVAFGDDYNDIEMVRHSGVGVAVDNAIDEVKAVADFVCHSNTADGVARWIEDNILAR